MTNLIEKFNNVIEYQVKKFSGRNPDIDPMDLYQEAVVCILYISSEKYNKRTIPIDSPTYISKCIHHWLINFCIVQESFIKINKRAGPVSYTIEQIQPDSVCVEVQQFSDLFNYLEEFLSPDEYHIISVFANNESISKTARALNISYDTARYRILTLLEKLRNNNELREYRS